MVEKALQKGLPVWTEVELAYLISDAPIIGITGSNGKTTTTTMIAEVLNAGGKSAKLCGNIGYPASNVAQEATKETSLSWNSPPSSSWVLRTLGRILLF